MKFNKHISLLLAVFLLISNMGLAINVHYCGDKIASVFPVYLKTAAVEKSSKKACCIAALKTKEKCCKDKVVHFQKKSDNFVVKKFFSSIAIAILLPEWIPAVFLSTSNFKVCSTTSYFCDANAPPFFKLYNQYIFYA